MDKKEAAKGEGATTRRTDLGAVLGLLVISLAFFGRAASGRWTFFHGDLHYLFYPLKVFYAESLHAGRLPLWNPYIGCGYPQLAEGQIAAFYPFNALLFGLLPITFAFNYSVIIHFALAGIFFYAFLRRRGLSPIASFVGAGVFEWSGFLISHLQHLDIVTSVAWLPLLLYLWEDGIQRALAGRESFSRALLAGIVLGIQALAGSPAVVFYSLLIGAIYLLCRFAGLNKEGLSIREPAFLFLGTLVVGASLSAVQSLPILGLVGYASHSSESSLSSMTSHGLVWGQLLTFLFPNSFGSPAYGTYVGVRWFWEVCGYLGIISLLLIGLGTIKRWQRSWPLVVLGAVGLILSFGKGNPVYLLLQYIPPFNSVGAAGRYLLLWTAAGAALAAEGAEIFLQRPSQAKKRGGLFLSLVAMVLLACWLVLLYRLVWISPAHSSRPAVLLEEWAVLGSGIALFFILLASVRAGLPRALTGSVLAAAILADLLVFAIPLAPTVPRSFYEQTPWTARRIAADSSWYRVWPWRTLEPTEALHEAYPAWASGTSNYEFDWERLRPNLPVLWHLRNVGAGVSLMREIESCIHITETDPLPGVIRGSVSIVRELATLLGAKYLILRQAEPNLELIDQQGELWLYRNPQAFPRAWVVGAATVRQTDAPALGALLSRMFPIREEAIIDRPLMKALTERGEVQAEIEIEEPRPEEIILHTRTDSDGLLILNESYDPNWSVALDDGKAPVYQADLLLNGVFLPAGKHTVKFTYRNRYLWVGTRVSLLAALLWALLGVRLWCKSKGPGRREEQAKPSAAKKGKRRKRS